MRSTDLLLCLEDERYGERLLAYLTGKKNPALHVELLTAGEVINVGREDQGENVVVLTDSRELKKDSRHRVILLSGMREEEGDSIFLYQKAEQIYRELMKRLGGGQQKGEEEKGNPDIAETDNGKPGIYFLLSPEGGIGALAVSLAQYLGQSGRCLYLNLTGFPLFYGSELVEHPDFDGGGIAELLFFVGQESFVAKERMFVRPFGKAWILAPPVHFRDLLDSRTEDWQRLFERLRKECGYQTIVVEAGHLFDSTLEVMELCEYPLFITDGLITGKVYRSVFEHYVRLEKRNMLQKRYICTRNPLDAGQEAQILGEGAAACGTGENSGVMYTIRQWLKQMEKEGENDCIIEYDE